MSNKSPFLLFWNGITSQNLEFDLFSIFLEIFSVFPVQPSESAATQLEICLKGILLVTSILPFRKAIPEQYLILKHQKIRYTATRI